MLRYLVAALISGVVLAALLLAIAAPRYDISEEVRIALAWLKPEQMLDVCGYKISSKLSLVGYEPEEIVKRTRCDSLDESDHCVLRCLERNGATEVQGGCYHLCGPSGGLAGTVVK